MRPPKLLCECSNPVSVKLASEWVCARCRSLATAEAKIHRKTVGVRGERQFRALVGNRKSGENYQHVDVDPIAGVGESLKYLEKLMERL